LTDLSIYVILFSEIIFVGGGTVVAARVARLTGRPPRGWLMLVAAFATQLIQAVCYLFVYFGPAAVQSTAQSAGQWLGVPALALLFVGVYFLYWDFSRRLKEREADILNPEA